jgi:hypothetical protein
VPSPVFTLIFAQCLVRIGFEVAKQEGKEEEKRTRNSKPSKLRLRLLLTLYQKSHYLTFALDALVFTT